ncbi:MAG: hypothetical protein WBA74_03685 [Cyclobacteriaceae bacterium]
MSRISTKITSVKKLQNSFKIIDRLLLKRIYSASSKDFDENSLIEMRKEQRGFSFRFDHSDRPFKYKKFDFKKILLKRGDFQFKVNAFYATSRTLDETSGIVGSFSSLNFDTSNVEFHRLIIPCSEKPNFAFSVENVSIKYRYKEQIRTRLAIEVELPEGRFHLYQVYKKLNDKTKPSYIVIDSQVAMQFRKFSEICHSILISFGFICGSFIQNEGFFFQYKNPQLNIPTSFYHTQFRKSIKALYAPIYSNPHGIIHDRKVANKYQNKIKVMSGLSFSRLCHLVHLESDVKSAIFLILETNNTSLVSSPGLFSIALETLANFIYQKNESGLAPIPVKRVAKQLRSELKNVIQNHSEKIGEEAEAILNKRIDQINQRTNREKLLIPFKILGIKLNNLDIQAIEQRNSFLHGKIPMIHDEKQGTISEEDKLRYFLHLKLFTLLSAIILKLSKFDGYIVNYPKIYESSIGWKVNEEHYRKI